MRQRLIIAAAMLLAVPRAIIAQLPTTPQAELRADAYATHTALAGFGASIPTGIYARPGAVYSLGVTDAAGLTRVTHRIDLLVRFLLDPLRQSRFGPYGVGGVAVTRREGSWREYLVVRLGVEGPQTHGVLPAVELGLGGGAHVGVVLRSGRTVGR